MIQHETKMRLSAVLAAVLASGSGSIPVAPTAAAQEMAPQEIVAKSREAYASLSSYRDTGTMISEIAGQKNTLSFKTRLERPSLYRIEWTCNTKVAGMPGTEGVVWSEGSRGYLLTSGSGAEKNVKPQPMKDIKTALLAASGPTWSTSLAIPGVFFHDDFRDAFVSLAISGHHPLTREKDDRVGNFDCYVLSSQTDWSQSPELGKQGNASTTLWIGKKDFLIHQSRSRLVHKAEATAPPTEQEVDEAIKKSLAMQNKPATAEAIAAMRPQMKAIMKQVQSTIKSGFESGIVNTRLHENIVVHPL